MDKFVIILLKLKLLSLGLGRCIDLQVITPPTVSGDQHDHLLDVFNTTRILIVSGGFWQALYIGWIQAMVMTIAC